MPTTKTSASQDADSRFRPLDKSDSIFSPALLDSLAAPGLQVEAVDLSLEEIFVDLAIPSSGADLKSALPTCNPTPEASA